MRYIVYVNGKELRASLLLEALLKARTIQKTAGIKPQILDTFSNEYIAY